MRPVLKKERRNWILPEPLRAQPGLEAFSSVFRQILHGRGVTRQSQLDPWLQTDLERAPDPFLLKDMAVACDLIADAVHRGERIGATLLAELLKKMGSAASDPKATGENTFCAQPSIDAGFHRLMNFVESLLDQQFG